MNLKDGEACGHRACLSHKTYPCPFCGRIAGRALTHSERVALAIEKEYYDPGLDGGREEYFADAVERIGPLVEEAFNDGLMTKPQIAANAELWRTSNCDTSATGGFLIPHYPLPKHRYVMWEGLKAIWAVVPALVSVIRDVMRGWKNDVDTFNEEIASVLRVISAVSDDYGVPPTLLGLPVYTSERQKAQADRDHYWKTVIVPRLREWERNAP